MESEYKTKNNGKIGAIFDLDGTLIDSTDKLNLDVSNACKKIGIKIEPYEIKGRDWHELVESYGKSKDDFNKALDEREPWAESLKKGRVSIFQDAIPCLNYLKNQGVRLSLLSKSIPKYTNLKVDYFNLKQYFENIVVTPFDAPSKRKEAIDSVKALIPIEKAYFIGDAVGDVTIADDVEKELGISTKGIYLSRDGKAIPKEVERYQQIKSLEELSGIIK